MARGDEKKFVEDLAKHLSTELHDCLTENSLTVEAHTKVLIDLTCGIYAGEDGSQVAWPTLSFMEQDLVIGRWVKPAKGMGRFMSNSTGKKWVFVPRLIIEAKYQGVDSHAVITYSEIAGRLKAVYQNLRYYFLIRCGSKMPWTLERQGRAFDRIYQLDRAKGNKSPVWPGAYEPGDLEAHIAIPEVGEGIRRLVRDIRADLQRPRVYSPAAH